MRNQHFNPDGTSGELVVPPPKSVPQSGNTRHVFCPTGFLDDTFWHRTYLIYGTEFSANAGGYFMTGRYAPGGRALAVDETHVYAYGRRPEYYRWTTPMEDELFRTSTELQVVDCPEFDPENKAEPGKGLRGCPRPFVKVKRDWTTPLPIFVRAMLLSQNKVFVAGPPDLMDEKAAFATILSSETQKLAVAQERSLRGRMEASLLVLSKSNGIELSRTDIPSPPVLNGLASASGRLYLSLVNGELLCLRPQ
jgi:hypothetical protein